MTELEELYVKNEMLNVADIDRLNEEEFAQLVTMVLQDEDYSKQKAYTRNFINEKLWLSKTPIFIRLLSLSQLSICEFAFNLFQSEFEKPKASDMKNVVPGLYAFLYYQKFFKNPPIAILNSDFFFGQLLIFKGDNEELLRSMVKKSKFLKALNSLLDNAESDEINKRAKELWVNRYGHIIPDSSKMAKADDSNNNDENEDYPQSEILVSNDQSFPEDEITRETILSQDQVADINNYPMEVRFFLCNTTGKLDLISSLPNVSHADLLLSFWIQSIKSIQEFEELNSSIISIHQAFGSESQRALLLKCSSLIINQKLQPEEFSEILIKYNLLSKYFKYFPDLQIEINQTEQLINCLIHAGENEQIAEGLLLLSRSNHEASSVLSTKILVHLLEKNRIFRRIIDQKLRVIDSKLIIALSSRLCELSAFNDDIIARLEEKESSALLLKTNILQEVGESLKDILRSMETKAAELLRSRETDHYFVYFLRSLRKELDRINLQSVEDFNQLGQIVEPQKGIHLRDGKGNGPFILKSIGLKTMGNDGRDYLLDNPRVESATQNGEDEQYA